MNFVIELTVYVGCLCIILGILCELKMVRGLKKLKDEDGDTKELPDVKLDTVRNFTDGKQKESNKKLKYIESFLKMITLSFVPIFNVVILCAGVYIMLVEGKKFFEIYEKYNH